MPFLLPLPARLSAEEAARRLAHRPGLAWLDGHGRGGLGRRSFVASDPVEQVQAAFGDPDPLGALAALEPASPARGPLAGTPRWIGWIGYDAAWSERPGARHRRAREEPVLWFGRYEAVARFEPGRPPWIVADTPEAARRLASRLRAEPPRLAPPRWRRPPEVRPGATAHARAVARLLEAIAEGEVYQANLARRWEGEVEGHPLALYLRLRRASPVPLGALLHGPAGRWLLSRSMERFLRWDRASGRLESRPIKGTAPWPGAGRVAARLRADPKERSEHAMIVDLVRNDLGRVARLGTVEVAELLRVEPYARLAHLVSVVRAEARPGLSLPELLRATFPPASVTGCPKEAAVEHIERLEPQPRGPYTGAIGFVDRTGGCSLAVAIRTAELHGERLRYFAGGGIVYDSDPWREVAETELKARVLADALPWKTATEAENGAGGIAPGRVKPHP